MWIWDACYAPEVYFYITSLLSVYHTFVLDTKRVSLQWTITSYRFPNSRCHWPFWPRRGAWTLVTREPPKVFIHPGTGRKLCLSWRPTVPNDVIAYHDRRQLSMPREAQMSSTLSRAVALVFNVENWALNAGRFCILMQELGTIFSIPPCLLGIAYFRSCHTRLTRIFRWLDGFFSNPWW